jgi:dihydrofolate reductase
MEKNKLIAIAAVAIDGTIGVGDKIPWRIPEDFKHFRNTTMGHTLVVGYNTYITLPEKAFEGRKYLVLNSNSDKAWDCLRDGVIQYNKLPDLLGYLEYLQDVDTVFIAGGAMMYNTLIDYCDKAIITWVYEAPEGDKNFPVAKLFTDFTLLDEGLMCLSTTGIAYKINTYKRK